MKILKGTRVKVIANNPQGANHGGPHNTPIGTIMVCANNYGEGHTGTYNFNRLDDNRSDSLFADEFVVLRNKTDNEYLKNMLVLSRRN